MLGGVPEADDVVLLQPNMELPNGTKLARVKVGANMDIGREYLQCAISNFKATKKQGNGHFLTII